MQFRSKKKWNIIPSWSCLRQNLLTYSPFEVTFAFMFQICCIGYIFSLEFHWKIMLTVTYTLSCFTSGPFASPEFPNVPKNCHMMKVYFPQLTAMFIYVLQFCHPLGQMKSRAKVFLRIRGPTKNTHRIVIQGVSSLWSFWGKKAIGIIDTSKSDS